MDKHVVQSRPQLPTNIEGDTLTGTARTPLYQGNVLMARGDQFLGADSVRMDTETDSYVAEGMSVTRILQSWSLPIVLRATRIRMFIRSSTFNIS